METQTQNSFKTGKHLLISLFILAIVAFGIVNANNKQKASADNPTFFFSASSDCTSVAASLTKPVGSTNLYLCVDGDNEGTGLLGAEVNIAYPVSLANIDSADAICNDNAFDTCINLSESGTIKFLAASGPASEDGKPVTKQIRLATITMDLLATGTANFTFSAAQVINENEDVETRNGANLIINIGVLPTCGNGTIDTGEECDGTKLGGGTCVSRGYDKGTLTCTASCTFNESACTKTAASICGDGKCDSGETAVTCPADCSAVLANCGNGAVETGEQCDDGNANNGDGCDSVCMNEGAAPVTPSATCGNGTIETGEECDGSNFGGKTCLNTNQGTGTLVCAGSCKINYLGCSDFPNNTCPNGIVEPGEECDDNNSAVGDGCDATCQSETEAASAPAPVPGAKTLSSVSAGTKFPISSVTPGSSSEIFAFAHYTDGSSESITSCFPCPTHAGDTRDGTTVYSSGGPASFSANFLNVSSGANAGDTVSFRAIYKGITSNTVSLPVTVSAPVTPPVVAPVASATEEGVAAPGEGEGEGVAAPGEGEGEGEGVAAPGEGEGEGVAAPGEGEGEGEGEGVAAPGEGEGEGTAIHPAPSAPTEAEITQSAASVILQQETLTQAGLDIPNLDTADKELTKKILAKCEGFSNQTDSDSDGLSDRTECYLLTDPNNQDTDGDGCWDGDEMNQFSTNPLAGDCNVEYKIDQGVVINDPQPGWVIPKVRVSGIAPKDSYYVSATAFPAEYKKLTAITDAIGELMTDKNDDAVKNLQSKIYDLDSLTSSYSDEYAYAELSSPIDSLRAKVEMIKTTEDLADTTDINEKEQAIDNSNLQENIDDINSVLERPAYLGSASDLGDAAIGGQLAKSFHLTPDIILTDKKPYDVVAIATVPGGTKSSAPVRFSIDNTLAAAGKPNPRTIGGEAIPSDAISMGNIFINGVKAEDGATIQLEIKDQKPTISGDSQYGSQVFAVWESIVLASSVISDSEQGAFDIQAPRNLEINTGHKITLYAVKADDTGTKMRSEDVNVYFRVKTEAFPLGLFLWITGITLTLILLIFFLRKRLRKKEDTGKEEVSEQLMEAEKAFEQPEMPEVIAATPPARTPLEAAEGGEVREPDEESISEQMPAEEIAHEEAEEMKEEIRPEESVIEKPMEKQAPKTTWTMSDWVGQAESPIAETSAEPAQEEYPEKEQETPADFTQPVSEAKEVSAKNQQLNN
jgi:cysteine-rich repeat protein